MSEHDRSMTGAELAHQQLAALGGEFFDVVHTADPFNSTQVGVTGFDALVPDPAATARPARRGRSPASRAA